MGRKYGAVNIGVEWGGLINIFGGKNSMDKKLERGFKIGWVEKKLGSFLRRRV